MRYLLLIYGCERPDEGSPEREARESAVWDYGADCARDGVLLAADPLHDSTTATSVRVRDGSALVTDGPYAETAEQLGGYFILECPDLDTALAYAARCPMAAEGTIEVRPIRETGLPGLLP